MLEVSDCIEQRRETLDISTWPAHGRAERLARLGIDVVICGGVRAFDEAGFDSSTVRLISGVAGPVETVIGAVCVGTIEHDHDYWGQHAGAQMPDH
jgi:hypothetical protein